MTEALREIRRENIRKLLKKRGETVELARLLGHKNSSCVSQMFGPNPTRDVTEGGARAVEALYGIPVGSLDKPDFEWLPGDVSHQEPKPTKNEAQNMTKEELLKLMRLLSALEAVSVLREQLPDYLLEDLSEAVAILEREILK